MAKHLFYFYGKAVPKSTLLHSVKAACREVIPPPPLSQVNDTKLSSPSLILTHCTLVVSPGFILS